MLSSPTAMGIKDSIVAPRRSSILAFPWQPAKAKPLKRWLRLRASEGTTSGSGNHLHVTVRALTENIEYRHKPSLQTVSQRIGYHPNYFSTLFKQETGMSFSDFFNRLRLRRAKRLLRETDEPLQSVAEQCGFSDLAYFSVRFKRAESISPSQWRAKQ